MAFGLFKKGSHPAFAALNAKGRCRMTVTNNTLAFIHDLAGNR